MAEAFVGPDITGDTKPDADITNAGDFTTIGGVTFTDAVRVGSGTGGYNTFLAFSNNGGVESGFNSDDTPPIDATNADIDQSKTHTVLLSSLVVTTIAGVQYYEVRVDLNESNNDPNAQISLDQFKLYTSTNGGLESTTQLFNPANATLRYDMDAGQDISILMSDAGSTGSGTDDYSVLIPVSMFAGLDPTTTYFYLYAQMGAAGTDWTATSTFEEWNLQNGVTLTGTKFEDINSNGIKDAGEGPVAGVTIFIDANQNGAFDAGERSTVTDANGNYSFYGVARDQTVWIDEVIPAGSTQTTGDHETIIISKSAAAGSTIVIDPIGNFVPHPSMNVTKAVSSITGGQGANGLTGADSAGDVIHYNISVQNTGNVALTGLVITDPNANPGSIAAVTSGGFNTGDTDHDGVFDAGETWNYTAAHTVTQAELDGKGIDIAGAIDGDGDDDNRVTADTDQTAPDTADAAAPLIYNPAMNVTKAATSITGGQGANGLTGADSAGDVIHYGISVQNTGNVTLTGLTVTDPNADAGSIVEVKVGGFNTGDTDNDGVFDVGETWNYTATHTVTQAELDGKGIGINGAIDGDGDDDNRVTADTNETAPDTADAAAPLIYNPAMNVTKAVTSITGGQGANGLTGADTAGDVIHYGISVQNTGNVTLTGLTVTDPNADAGSIQEVKVGGFNTGDTDNDGVFDVGETWNYTATHTVTQGELDGKGIGINGAIDGDGDDDNRVTADTNETAPDTADAAAPLIYDPSMNVTKDVSSITGGQGTGGLDGADDVGDVINYAISVQNTGNVTLTGLTVTDPNADPGSIVEVKVGGFNTGDTDNDGVFDVGETWNYTATHTVTQGDFDGNGIDIAGAPDDDGDIDNRVTADTNETGPDTADAVAPLILAPEMNVTKDVTSITGGQGVDGLDGADSDGDVINYAIAVENTGNVALTGVIVTDPNADLGSIQEVLSGGFNTGDSDQDGVLDVGETWNYTAAHTVTQAELDGKGIDIGGLIDGDGDDDNRVTADTDQTGPDTADASAPLIYDPSMDVSKDVTSIDGGQGVDGLDGADSDGDVINYAIAVENTGNVTLTGLTITDPNADAGSIQEVLSGGFNTGDTDQDGDFDVGETWNYTAAHTVTQAELDGKGIGINGAIDGDGDDDNRVTADTNETPEDTADAAAPLLYNPGIDLEKYVSVDSTDGTDGTFVDADDALGPENVNLGTDVWFHVTVENTGNITLTDVDITDENQTGGGSVNFDLMQNGALTVDAINNHSASLDGDTDGDGQLDVGETWTITYKQPFDFGDHVNVATVTTAEGQTDNDAAHYFSLVDEGLCPRTPGFWQNPKNGGQFWDGVAGNEKHAGEAGFPDGELLYAVDSNHDGVINGSDQKGLLLGDYDKDGITDADEDTLFVSYADAQTLINASNKQLNGASGDGRYMLGRDMIASWLNYLQGSGFGDASDPQSPHHYMDDAIDWMQIYSGTNGGGTTETFDKLKLSGAAIKTNTATWNTPQSGIDHSAGQMHSALDYYNNTGQTQAGGTHYANCDCDCLQEALSIYQTAHSLV